MSRRNEFKEGYKRTEAGWIPVDWEEKQICDIADLNPGNPRGITDETKVSFVPMASVSEDGRVVNQQVRKYVEVSKGYTYFAEGDILVAKITPCFENGKGALVTNLENGIGLGSTEFHVLRAKGVNSAFLFLHTRSYRFRTNGVTNMTGSVGQKRVPSYFLADYWLGVPDLVEQQKIVDIIIGLLTT